MKKQKLGEQSRYYFGSIGFLGLAAIFLTWFLEYRYFINDAAKAWDFIAKNPAPFFFNALLVFLILTFLWGIFHKAVTAMGVAWVIFAIFSYIHISKYNSRGTPLLPEDFGLANEANTLTKFVDIWSILRLLVAVGLVIAMTIVFNRLVAPKLGLLKPKKRQKKEILVSLLIITVSVATFMGVTDFARHNKGERYEDIPFLGTRFTAWNQNTNYNDNGFLLGFLYNLQKLQLDQPGGYSPEEIAKTKSTHEELAAIENVKRKNIASEGANVVIVLNESFYDPSVELSGKKFEDYYTHSGGEILPNLRKIQDEYPSGYMYTTDYGGGTANIEFEAFTSMTNYWLNTVPYTSLVPKAGKIPSIASMLRQAGYATIAIHPFNGGMYKRSISLINEGFDKFITKDEMDYTERDGNSEYINDRSAYRQVLRELKDEKKPLAIGLITMQNHAPYNADIYEQTEFAITNKEVDEAHRTQIATYYQSLHNSDAYLGEFMQELDNLDEKTVVLFFGDHSAGLFDLTNNSEDSSVRDLSRLTPYFMYANYDAGMKKSSLPMTTPNCLVNTLLDRLNWQKAARYYLVGEACAAEPILASNYIAGRELKETQSMNAYKLMIYDVLGGKKYWGEE